MPSLFISSTTCSPNGVRPPCSGGSACESAQSSVHVVSQRHVAHAEIVVGAQRAERVLDRVSAFHAQQRSDASGAMRGADVGHGGRELQAVGIARDHPPRDVDLLELRAREAAGRSRPECTRTRTARRRRRASAARGRSDRPSACAGRTPPRRPAPSCSCESPTADRCDRRRESSTAGACAHASAPRRRRRAPRSRASTRQQPGQQCMHRSVSESSRVCPLRSLQSVRTRHEQRVADVGGLATVHQVVEPLRQRHVVDLRDV